MTITVEAVYESEVLRPLEPLDALKQHKRELLYSLSTQSPSSAGTGSRSTPRSRTRSLSRRSTTCSPNRRTSETMKMLIVLLGQRCSLTQFKFASHYFLPG